MTAPGLAAAFIRLNADLRAIEARWDAARFLTSS